jgi:hypothetical protein
MHCGFDAFLELMIRGIDSEGIEFSVESTVKKGNLRKFLIQL